MPKHFFFDLDKTLTVSRSPMLPEHQEIFDRLCNAHDVIVVTGGKIEQIREQITPRFEGKYIALAQSGNHALDLDGAELWREALSDAQSAAIHSFIEKLKAHFNVRVKDENDLIEHRGAQISYSVIGFHESVEKKYAFDPDEQKRAVALEILAADVALLHDAGVEVTPAGTTTYNFILRGRHKGFNVARLVELKGWDLEDCIYIGDALFPGGNDATVIGVVPTKAVTSPAYTFAYLATLV